VAGIAFAIPTIIVSRGSGTRLRSLVVGLRSSFERIHSELSSRTARVGIEDAQGQPQGLPLAPLDQDPEPAYDTKPEAKEEDTCTTHSNQSPAHGLRRDGLIRNNHNRKNCQEQAANENNSHCRDTKFYHLPKLPSRAYDVTALQSSNSPVCQVL
jgi:hypothetical protein